MNVVNRRVSASAFALALLIAASAAHAQAARSWVSSFGDDANSPCSRTTPCKTFAGAFPKTAAKGRINVIDPGTYGSVTVYQSMTIEAEQYAGIYSPGVSGIIINAAPTDVVVLRGLTIDGGGTGLSGIRILQARQVHIENCTIQNFANRGIIVENTSNAIQAFIRNTIIRNNAGAALPAGNSGAVLLKPTMTGTVNATLDNVSMDQNTFGLRVEPNSRATVSNSTASGNSTFGIHVVVPVGGTTAAAIALDNVVISNNATGVQAEGSAFASVRLASTTITSNSLGLSSVGGGQFLSWGNNPIAGNGTDGAPTGLVVPLK